MADAPSNDNMPGIHQSAPEDTPSKPAQEILPLVNTAASTSAMAPAATGNDASHTEGSIEGAPGAPLATENAMTDKDGPSLTSANNTTTIVPAATGIANTHCKSFKPTSNRTAKCDVCDHRNESVLQRCKTCARQLCKTCMYTPGDGIHHIPVDDPTWVPDPRAHKNRPPPHRKSNPPVARKPLAMRKNTAATKSVAGNKMTKDVGSLDGPNDKNIKGGQIDQIPDKYEDKSKEWKEGYLLGLKEYAAGKEPGALGSGSGTKRAPGAETETETEKSNKRQRVEDGREAGLASKAEVSAKAKSNAKGSAPEA